ncbi:MAG: peptide-methionine (S)-S-oxide reductase MsrA [Gemmatimonadaceae bacterium]
MKKLLLAVFAAVVGFSVAAAAVVSLPAAEPAASVASSYAVTSAPWTGATLSPTSGETVAIFAGGCFWGVEAVFEHLAGVKSAVSGYAGGSTHNPSYGDVSSGSTGHAEAVRVVYDPSVISYGTLLQVFFSVAHDPTQLNRQGPDVGTQYRSAIFAGDAEEQQATEAYIRQLMEARTFRRPIVTEVVRLETFFPAEDYHQDYLAHHPDEPYIVYNDAPKLVALKRLFPALYREPVM